MVRFAVCSVALAVVLGSASPAQAQTESTILYIGLPIIDGIVFVGGVTAGLAGSVSLADARPSSGWRTANLAFGGLNCASTLGYGIAMGVTGAWAYLLWPLAAHAGLAIANLVIGNRLTRLERASRVALVPLAGLDRGAAFGGVALRFVN